MEFVFYMASLVAVVSTVLVISHNNPIHALLYLVISLLAVSAVFFSLGAYFAGAFEIIVYAGAIMVLFVFVVMMLNLGECVAEQERSCLKLANYRGPIVLSTIFLTIMVYAITSLQDHAIKRNIIDVKEVGIALFHHYLLAVEIMSMLLLAGLVVAFHLGRERKQGEDFNKVKKLYTNELKIISVKNKKSEDLG
ncbi:NADH-quinone oxidoreductase subunit J [Candidatus Profftia tarda]|nr:NADH-quinone oxidoreductase subunit J [Candidatus Profftia tarda]